MTLSNWKSFRVAGRLCSEFTGRWWFPRTKANDTGLWFSLICAWINSWVNNGEAGYLRHHRAHYDVIVMLNTFVNSSLCFNTIQLKRLKIWKRCIHERTTQHNTTQPNTPDWYKHHFSQHKLMLIFLHFQIQNANAYFFLLGGICGCGISPFTSVKMMVWVSNYISQK